MYIQLYPYTRCLPRRRDVTYFTSTLHARLSSRSPGGFPFSRARPPVEDLGLGFRGGIWVWGLGVKFRMVEGLGEELSTLRNSDSSDLGA